LGARNWTCKIDM